MKARVQFRVLGPLEVWCDGQTVSVGGPRQRALLALLLCHANQVLSRDQLIDELLGHQNGGSPKRALRVQVSRLRKALAGSGDLPRLIARPPGYLLRVESGELDLHTFEGLVGKAREAAGRDDPGQAAALLHEAEGLWRGRPFADLEFESFARVEVQRLEELRLAAVEDRIDAELALGHNAALCAELTSLSREYPLRERLRGQLMLALYRAGRQADALAVYRQTGEFLRDELGIEPGRALRALERSILEQDLSLEATARVSIGNGPDAPDDCPFKGLEAFERSDAEYFFGRERLVTKLLASATTASLVGILGPPGIGKSSLMRTGLLAALNGDGLPGSASWRQVLLRPGERPCRELARAIGGQQLDAELDRLSPGERLVVAVDQLEELFTTGEREEERAAFLEQLAAAARDDQRRVLVLVALRGDFYVRFASYRRFADLLSRSHVLVGPMDRDELARAIEQPAARAGLEIERPLVDALVSDTAGQTGALPLLSATLLELWDSREGTGLRYRSYKASGGVHAAVARLAEAAYGRLSEPDQQVARNVMLRLASERDGTLTRRRVPVGELERIDGANPVVAALIDARLLTLSDGKIELSHEALLSEWPRYRTWLEEDRVGRRVHAHLTAAAGEWEAQGRDPGELYRGARLAGALDWVAQHGDRLNALEREFVDWSRTEAERVARRQRAQNRWLRGLLLGVGLLLVIAVIAGAIAVVKRHTANSEARVALARQLGAEAVNEPRLDLAMLLAREGVNLDRSPQTEGTLLATLQRAPGVIGTFALPVGRAPQLALSPNGRTLTVSHFLINEYGFSAPGVSLGDVRFYDPSTHAVQRAPLTDFGGARPPVYSNDGSLLAYPTSDALPTIAVRNARTSALVSKLGLDPFQVATRTPDLAHASILIAPNDHTVYCAYRTYETENRTGSGLVNAVPGATYLARWSLPGGQRLSSGRVDSGAVLAVRLIDAGARLLVVDTHSISVFDANSLRRLSSVAITPAPSGPSAAAISPGGRSITVGSQTGQVLIVDPQTGEARTATGTHSTSVTTLTYSPSGRAVVSTGDSNEVIVWNPRTARSTAVMTAPAEQVLGVAFSPDGTTLYTASLSGLLLDWDLAHDRSFGRRFVLGAGSRCCGAVSPAAPPLALSPDGARFAVRLGRSTVGLFSARTVQRRASFTITPKGNGITALAWSPTPSELAVAGHSGIVQLWQVDSAPRLVRSLTGLQPIGGLPEAVQALAFSPDGRLLAASDSSETLESPGAGDLAHYGNRLVSLAIWRASNGKPLAPPRDLGTGPSRYSPLAFSRDGKLLAVSVPDTHGDPIASDLILDPTTGHVRQTLHALGADDTVSLAFAPNGTLATGTQGGIVQLWNPLNGRQIAGPAAVGPGPVTSIAFDPAGHRFATTDGQDATVKLWFAPTLQQEGAALNTERGAADTVAFEPGGGTLFASDDRGNVFAWPTSLDAWEQRACSIARRNLTRSEWARFIPGHGYTNVCK